MPAVTSGVRVDTWTKNPEDAQKIFYLLGSKEKEMIWIELSGVLRIEHIPFDSYRLNRRLHRRTKTIPSSYSHKHHLIK
jgi:hypothetical protein